MDVKVFLIREFTQKALTLFFFFSFPLHALQNRVREAGSGEIMDGE